MVAFQVTILILIDGFLQLDSLTTYLGHPSGHNPYFNRWFSAIYICGEQQIGRKSHNPYFNRWFSAIKEIKRQQRNAE